MLSVILGCAIWTLVCLAIASLYLCLSRSNSQSAPSAAVVSQQTDSSQQHTSSSNPRLITIAAEQILYKRHDGNLVLAVDKEILASVTNAIRIIPISIVENDEEQEEIQSWWVGENNDQFIPIHRLLFCESVDSRATMIRQIGPNLHIESRADCMSKVHGTIPATLIPKADEVWEFLMRSC